MTLRCQSKLINIFNLLTKNLAIASYFPEKQKTALFLELAIQSTRCSKQPACASTEEIVTANHVVLRMTSKALRSYFPFGFNGSLGKVRILRGTI